MGRSGLRGMIRGVFCGLLFSLLKRGLGHKVSGLGVRV